MNGYTKVLEYFKDFADSSDYINTAAQGETQKIAADKRIIYPMLHVAMDTGGFSSGWEFQVNLTSLDQLDRTHDETDTDNFWSQSNEVDVYNETLAELYKLWQKIVKDFPQNKITIVGEPTTQKIKESTHKILIGWEMTITIIVPNTHINLCAL